MEELRPKLDEIQKMLNDVLEKLPSACIDNSRGVKTLDIEELKDIVTSGTKEYAKKFYAKYTKAQIISALAQLALKDKWYKDSEEQSISPCIFCEHARTVATRDSLNPCPDCFCPKEICASNGHAGLIAEHDDNAFVKDHPKMNEIIAAFKKLV